MINTFLHTRNEPMTIDKFCADGKATPAFGSYQSMFNYYDACENGLARADSKLRIGGPTTHSSVDATADIITKFLDHIDTGDNFFSHANGTRLDFISIHRKGSDNSAPGGGSTGTILEHERAFFDLIRTKHPRLQHLPFLNDEGDPLSGWSKDRSWRPGPIYPAFMVKAVAQHVAAMDDASPPAIGGVAYTMLSNDNSFTGGWNERTLITTFTNTTQASANDSGYSVIKKPDLSVMPLMNRLGVRRIGLHVEGGADAAQLGVIASGGGGGSRSVSDDNCVAIMLHRSDDTASTMLPALPVALHVTLLANAKTNTTAKWPTAAAGLTGAGSRAEQVVPNVNANVTVAHWRLDEAYGNPHAVWLKQGSPSWPSTAQLAAMAQVEEAALLSCTSVAPVPTNLGNTYRHGQMHAVGSMVVDINITMPLPAVSLLQICARPSQGPPTVALAPLLLQKRLGATVVFWRPIPAAAGGGVVRTYTVQYSTSGPNGSFEPVNNASDMISTAWIHRYIVDNEPAKQRAGQRCYRVLAVDYWGRGGSTSPPACH